MKIKKMTALLMSAAMTVSLAACGGSGQSTGAASERRAPEARKGALRLMTAGMWN